jgi:hypothetical protein
MEHAPCSPDLAPSDYHVFGPLKKFLDGHRFISDDDAKTAVQQRHLQTSGVLGQMPEPGW